VRGRVGLGRAAAVAACVATLAWIALGVVAPPKARSVPGTPIAPLSASDAPKAPGVVAPTVPIKAVPHVPAGWRGYLAAGTKTSAAHTVSDWYPRRDHTAVLVSPAFPQPVSHMYVEWVARDGASGRDEIPLPSVGAPWAPVDVRVDSRARAVRFVVDTPPRRFVYFSVPYIAGVDVAGGLGDIGRLILTAIGVMTLVFGPGLGLAAWRGCRVDALTVALPGVAVLSGVGVVAWVSGGWRGSVTFAVDEVSYNVARSLAAVVALGLLAAALGIRRRAQWTRQTRMISLVFVLVLAVAVLRGTWSGSMPGELYGGSISRVLENGNRPDSRTSYLTAQVFLGGLSPASRAVHGMFTPYQFGDRGPLSGLVAVPVIAGSGGRPAGFTGQPWQVFDRQGFAAYRVVLDVLNLLVLFGIAGLATRLAGRRAGLYGALLAGLTPFVVHETYFTWPKMFAAYFVLVAGGAIVRRRPLAAGVAMVAGYLSHPLAMLWLPALLLFAVWRERLHGGPTMSDRAGRLRTLAGSSVQIVAAPIVAVAGWFAFNYPYRRGGDAFAHYPLQVDAHDVHTVGSWLVGRLHQIGTTLVPGYSVYWTPAKIELGGGVGGHNGPLERWAMQYWTTLPFAIGVLALPLLTWALWRMTRVQLFAVMSTVVVPFVVFVAFWGSFVSGSMREGLHPWLATLLVVCAVALATQPSPLAHRVWWWLAAGRGLEMLAMIAGTMILEGSRLITRQFLATDLLSIVLGLGCVAALTGLAFAVVPLARWIEPPSRPALAPAAPTGLPGRSGG
jgi:hypothetical protein